MNCRGSRGLFVVAFALAAASPSLAQPDEDPPPRERPGMEDLPPPLRRLGPDGARRMQEWIEDSPYPGASKRVAHQILKQLTFLQELKRRKREHPRNAPWIEGQEQRVRERLRETLGRVPLKQSGSLLDILGPELAEAEVGLPAPWTKREPGPRRDAPAVEPFPRAEKAPLAPPAFAELEPPRQGSEPGRRGGPPPAIILLALLASLITLAVTLRRRIAAWIVELGTPARHPPPAGAAAASGAAEGDLPNGPLPTGYRILKRIGEGGMGTVFEAVDVSLERRVAVKRMRPEIRDDPRERERFLKEARTVAKLRHPGIIEIHAIVENAGEIYLVFEFLDGRTLEAAISGGGPLDLGLALRVVRQTCAALDYAHGLGVVHRDLKPSNIMLLPDGLVKVMDFGVARQAKDARDRLSMTNTVTGTPLYMAPEAETGVVRRESDVYGVGVFLYEMLTGERPFAGIGAGLLLNKMNMTYVPPSRKVARLGPAVDAVLAQALQADPERRPRTAGELASAFAAAVGGIR